MKRLASLLLALLLALSCVGITAFAAEDEEVTLTVWIGGPGKQKDSDEVWALFNEMLQDYLPNTTVEFVAVPLSEYAEKWSKAMAAGEKIDVAWFGWIIDINDEVAKGSLMPINNLIDEYGADMVETLGESVFEAHSINGEVYAIPCWQSLGPQSVWGIYLRDEVLETLDNPNYVAEFEEVMAETANEYSIESFEKYYDKMEEYLEGAKNADKLGLGFFAEVDGKGKYRTPCSVIGDYDYLNYIMWGDDSFTLNSTMVTGSEAYEIELYKLERLHDFWQKGYFRADLLSADDSDAFGADLASSTVIYRRGMDGFLNGYYTADEQSTYFSNKYGTGITAVQIESCVLLEKGYATSTCIPYTAENPERAMEYINLMNSTKATELYRLLVYGIEGKHYDVDENGYVNVYGGSGNADSSWDYGQWTWAIGNCLNTYSTTAKTSEYWSKLSAMEKDAIIDPMYNFAFDKTGIETECVNCLAIFKEYKNMFAYDDYEARIIERNQKMMDAGYQKILDALQTQIDAYVSANGITGWPELPEYRVSVK